MFSAHDDAPDPRPDSNSPPAGVVIKPPLGDESDIRGQEARRLKRLHHPGIVELVEAIDGPDGTTLHLAQVPGAVSLSEAVCLSVSELLDIAKQLAEAVAYLHSTGTAHNAVTTEHVLLGEHNRLVLCGFGNSNELSDKNACIDVVAFGGLLLDQLELSVAGGSANNDDALVVGLRHLGRLATNCQLTETSAQSLADRLGLLQTETSQRDAAQPALADTLLAVGRIAGGLVIGVLVVGFVWSTLRPSGLEAPTRQAAEVVEATTGPEAIPTGPQSDPQATSIPGTLPTDGELVAATTPQCPAIPSVWEELSDVRWIDLDGDNCLDPWRHENGVLHTAKGRFAVGGPGDSFTLGDWNCDGIPTPAIASDGLLYLFDTAPYSLELGAQAIGAMFADVPAIVSIDIRPNGNCDDLIITNSQGETSILATSPMAEATQ